MPISTIGVYWAARAESVEACSARLATCFRSLRSEFPALADWYKVGKATSQPISHDAEGNDELVKLLMAGRNKTDVGRQVIENLGFRVSLWNKRKPAEAMSLSVKCGLYSRVLGLSNVMVLSMPKNPEALGLGDDAALRKLLLLMIDAWSPDWGAVFDNRGDAINARKNGGPFLDKMLWLKNGLSFPEESEKAQTEDAVFDGVLYLR